MSEQEFINKYFPNNEDTLHIRLWIYYKMNSTQEERDALLPTDILRFDFLEGRYTISVGDLLQKVGLESDKLK